MENPAAIQRPSLRDAACGSRKVLVSTAVAREPHRLLLWWLSRLPKIQRTVRFTSLIAPTKAAESTYRICEMKRLHPSHLS